MPVDEIFYDELVLFAQIEAEYGVSPGAFAAAHAMLVRDLRITPLQGDRIERDIAKGHFGANASRMVRRHAKIGFKGEMTGPGLTALAAGEAPPWGLFARMCGMAEVIRPGTAAGTIAATKVPVGSPTGTFTYAVTGAYTGTVDRLITLTCTTGGGSGVAAFTVSAPAIANLPAHSQTGQVMTDATPFALVAGATITPTVGTSFEVGDSWTIQLRAAGTTYAPITRDQDSLHAFYQIGPNRHLLAGLRGDCSFEFPANNWPDITVDGSAIYTPGTSEDLPAQDKTRFFAPEPVEFGTTPYVALAGLPLRLQGGAVLKAGQQVAFRSYPGVNEARITRRASTLEITVEAIDIATRNLVEDMALGSVVPFELIHGTRGKLVHVKADRVQITGGVGEGYADDDGTAVVKIEGALLPSDAGNDEFSVRAG